MQTEKTDIKSLYFEELAAKIGEMGEKKFRATQIFEWLHKHQVKDVSQMINLPATLRERLSESFSFVTLKEVRRLASAQDETIKLLFALPDNKVIESVFMK